ncbi:MAG: D-alanyl-D-alanine dipeptidase [Deltaproteobacteria bacterium]|nr:D-alanyl-D-alanine dipeptidase [Deltaproteobacteria bacterium]
MIELVSLDPTIWLDIRYATTNNFTGRKVYTEPRAFLQRPAAEALVRAHKVLQQQGYRLKIYDAYRPLAVQKIFWKVKPDERYIADPTNGSRHNRGMAVDLTLTDLQGKEVSMPTPYDDFTPKASATYNDLPPEVIRHREILQKAMVTEGFAIFPTEWWHFDYKGWEKFPVLDIPFPPR